MLRDWLKRQFPSTILAAIPVGIAINVGMGTLVQAIKLPVFLDSVGTVLLAVLGGPAPAIVTAVASGLVGGLLTDPLLPCFAFTSLTIGWFSGFCANRGAFRRLWVWAICGVLMGVIAAIVSAPVIAYLLRGVTQGGSSMITAWLMATGKTVLNSVVLAGLACDPVDKLVTFLIAWGLIKGLPRSFRARFPRGIENTEPVAADPASQGR